MGRSAPASPFPARPLQLVVGSSNSRVRSATRCFEHHLVLAQLFEQVFLAAFELELLGRVAQDVQQFLDRHGLSR